MKNIFTLIDELIIYEMEHGIVFENNMPVIPTHFYASTLPNRIAPYHRRIHFDKRGTSICFYEPDANLYSLLTLEKLESVARIVSGYDSFIGFDLSIFRDFLQPLKDFYALANVVIDVFLCLHGCKLIPNLRISNEQSQQSLEIYNQAKIVCCSTHGCSKRKSDKEENTRCISNYLKEHNQTILIYGPPLLKGVQIRNYYAYGRRRKGEMYE